MVKSKPFRTNHAEQIKLVKSFAWLDFKALKNIDEEFEALLIKNTHFDKNRKDALCGAAYCRARRYRLGRAGRL